MILKGKLKEGIGSQLEFEDVPSLEEMYATFLEKYKSLKTSTARRIFQCARAQGAYYGDCLGEKSLDANNLKKAFFVTLAEVASAMDAEQDHNIYARMALWELQLLTQIDASLREGDFNRVVIDSRDMPTLNDPYPTIVANLRGIEVKVTGTDKAGNELARDIVARTATWNFDEHGIRLEIEYEDLLSKEISFIHAGMDFHFRPNVDAMQAAFDIRGKYIDLFMSYMDMDYHRSGYLDGVVTADMLNRIEREHFKRINEKYDEFTYPSGDAG